MRTDLIVEVPQHLSYSSVATYSSCGEKYRLTKGRGIKEDSWYATVAGSVIHTITEMSDRRELGECDEDGVVVEVPDFKTEFLRLVKENEDRGIKLKASGKKSAGLSFAGGPNKKDVAWWLEYGPRYLGLWRQWRADNPNWIIASVMTPDGGSAPAIELEFNIKLGEETVKGFIDRVFYDTTTGQHILVDLKSGKEPEGQLQLGDYGVGLMEAFGIQATYGAYWYVFMPRDGGETTTEVPMLDAEGEPVVWKSGAREGQARTTKTIVRTPAALASRLSEPTDLNLYTKDYAQARYEMARDGIMAGVFLPNVTMMCKSCGVKDFCRAVGGEKAIFFPTRELFISKRTPKEVVVTEGLTTAA